jgi:hypothetical protein
LIERPFLGAMSSRRRNSRRNTAAWIILTTLNFFSIFRKDIKNMALFRNYYRCAHCSYEWADEWSTIVDDDCRDCGARDMSPYESDDLTEVSERDGAEFVVLWSPKTAGHEPDYRELARFYTHAEAVAFLAGGAIFSRVAKFSRGVV